MEIEIAILDARQRVVVEGVGPERLVDGDLDAGDGRERQQSLRHRVRLGLVSRKSSRGCHPLAVFLRARSKHGR